jgi:hypothetical protein
MDGCPPDGDDDVRCEWHHHTGNDPVHELNGVLAVTLDGSVASQSGIITSDLWPDSVVSAQQWSVNYDVHFVAVNAGDIPNLHLISRYKYAGVTKLTLTLNGAPGAQRVEYQTAPTHHWTETPESGAQWTLELTAERTAAGSPAMIWVDNIVVVENGIVLYEERFPESPAAAPLPDPAADESPLRLMPNPTRAGTTVQFDLPREEEVRIDIYDVKGRLVRALSNGMRVPGAQSVPWNGRGIDGLPVPAGIYAVRVAFGDRSYSSKITKIE